MLNRLKSSKRSLTLRLTGSIVFVLTLLLGLTGYLLDRAFYNSQITATSERLFIRVFNLLSLAEYQQNRLILPILMPDERFNTPSSGLMAMVFDENQHPVWASESARWFDQTQYFRSLTQLSVGESEFGEFEGWVYQRNAFIWETPSGDALFEFWVLEDASALTLSVQTFRSQLWGGFSVVGVLMLMLVAALLIWGLAPLRALTQQLERVRSGERESLEGTYPKELAPLTNSLNQLLKTEQSQRERYRKAMADLAHSLKTPLAVMRAVSADEQGEIQNQISRMDQIVRYQLQRAVADTRHGAVLGQKSDVVSVLNRVGHALEKAYVVEGKTLDIPEIDQPIWVGFDENDLLEVIGNVLENAFKYARSLICVELKQFDGWVELLIDDDGQGIAEADRDKVLARGARLDTLAQGQGQGIGLAMVSDILDSYQLALSIGDAPIGGARFRLRLPCL